MTFAEYIEAIQKNNEIFCIEEHCQGRFVGNHLVFGYIENENDEANGFYSYQENSWSPSTHIDPKQDVEFRTSCPGIVVKDTDGNVVVLVFYRASPIENPVPSWSDVA